MTATTFDTLAYSKKMKTLGFTEEQAEGQAEALAEAIGQQVATKKDLEIQTYKLTIRLGTMIVSGIGILAFLMNWMLKGVPHS